MSGQRGFLSLIMAGVVASLVSGCGWWGSTAESGSDSAAPKTALERFYQQKLQWRDCGEGNNYRCADVVVPVDYDHPAEQGEIKLQVIKGKSASDNEKKPVLLYNPGGPGFSGLAFFQGSYRYFPKDVRNHFDIVSFDPRGVGKSNPIQCLQPSEIDEKRAESFDFQSQTGRDASVKKDSEYFKNCEKRTHKPKGADRVLEFFSSAAVVKDMDVIRQTLGQKKLNFVGQSYGSKLGLLYASNFPEQTGRIVLDAVLDPFVTNNQLLETQMAGMEASFTNFVQTCLSWKDGTCPFNSLEDAKQKVTNLLDSLGKRPLPVQDRFLTRSLASSAIVGCMYSVEYYQDLATALGYALNPDHPKGDYLLDIADQLSGRDQDGHYPDSGDSNRILHFLDFRVDGNAQTATQFYQNLVQKYPLFSKDYIGDFYRYQTCSFCQAATKHNQKLEKKFEGAKLPAMLMLSNKYDPATAHSMAQKMHKEITNSKLITVEDSGHESLLLNNSCVDQPVSEFLIKGTLPTADLSCPKPSA